MIQYNILKQTIKKNYKYILIFITYLLLSILLLKLQSSELYYSDILRLIESKDNLLIIYKTFLIIYLTYYFYTYEMTNIYDLILLRIRKNKFYISKILFIILFIILFNIAHYIIINLFFKIDIKILLDTIIFYILITTIELLLINILNNKTEVFILTYIFSFIVYSIEYKLLIILILIIINYIIFKNKHHIIIE